MTDSHITSDSSNRRTLSLIDSNPITNKEKFIALFSSEFANDEVLPSALNALLAKGWCQESEEGLHLTEAGRIELESIYPDEYSVEKEDTSSEDPTKPYLVSKLKMEPKTLSIFQALRKIEKEEINLNPDFQRAFVWDIEKQSRLIESVLIRIPLPAFYLDATEQTKWSVVDGLQRLSTLYKFWKNEFRLKGLQFLTELNGTSFDELPAKFKILLEDDTSLQFYNLMPGTPIEAKYTIFSRVNTGGMQLTAQEIRHALTQGKVTPWLKEIAHSEKFIKATGGAVESRRMSDRELALRGLAFMNSGIENYRKFSDLDSFLIEEMENLNKKTPEELNNIKNKFESSLEKVTSIFGKYSFRKFYVIGGRRSPLNKALFEAWITGVSIHSEENLRNKKELIIENFIKTINIDMGFIKSISSGTGSYFSVEKRFNTIAKILKESLDA